MAAYGLGFAARYFNGFSAAIRGAVQYAKAGDFLVELFFHLGQGHFTLPSISGRGPTKGASSARKMSLLATPDILGVGRVSAASGMKWCFHRGIVAHQHQTGSGPGCFDKFWAGIGTKNLVFVRASH